MKPSALVWTALCCGLLPAAPATAADELPSVVISGYRAGLTEALQRRQRSLESVDTIVAPDIHKLPDVNLTEALQRLPGIQITRDRGEGTGVAIRGLRQVETLLDGREAFSAGTARALDMTVLPAELVSSIEVYKTADASRVSGELGGTVNVRTRRPMDFDGRVVALTARAVQGDSTAAARGQLAGLYSDRRRLEGHGEIGWLLHLVQQDRAWHEDQRSIGQNTTGQPSSLSESSSSGLRRRRAAHGMLQWRPEEHLELYAEATKAELRTTQDTYQFNAFPGRSTVATPWPGTQDTRSVVWQDAAVSILGFARDTVDRVWQGALGGRWRREGTEVSADLSTTRAHSNLFFSGLSLAPDTTVPVTLDTTTHPATSASRPTVDLLDPSRLHFTGVNYRRRPYSGQLDAVQVDARHPIEWGPVRRLGVGVRLATRRAGNGSGLIFGDAPATGPVTAVPGLTIANPHERLFPADTSIGAYLAGNPSFARTDPQALRDALGITAPIPTTADALALWRVRERSTAAYVDLQLRANELPLDGNIGVRLVDTRVQVDGYRSVPDSGGTAPLEQSTRDTRLLPAMHLRWTFSPATQLRAAASRTVTRPSFDQISPSLTLVRNTVDPTQNRGQAGNPSLQPIRSNNLDLSFDHRFSRSGLVSATLFAKRVDGFVSDIGTDERIDGVIYRITRPQNARSATLQGLELTEQQFFDFLPGMWRHFGAQATYTFVDGQAPVTAVAVRPQPLQELSRHSANLVAMFERAEVSARVAYNWRSRFVSGYTAVVGTNTDNVPSYIAAYGWLDAALNLRLNDRTTLGFEAGNLLRTRRWGYFGVETRPQNEWLNERQFALTLSLQL